MSKRVAIGMIAHETNCFSAIPTPLSAWQERIFAVGEDILKNNKGKRTNLGGFIEIAEREGWILLPTVAASAVPSAPTDAKTYAYLKGLLLEPLKNQKVDAVLLALHGAMVAEGVDDPELDIVNEVRKIVGDVPIIITLDLHGNLQKEMVENCEGVFGYDTNPHIDLYERAVESAELLTRIFNEGLVTKTAIAHSPMSPPTINMRTGEGPMVPLFDKAREYEAQPGVYNVSVFGGFALVDTSYASLSVVTTAKNRETAQKICDEIAEMAWANKEAFLKTLLQPAEALDRAETIWDDNDPRPIIIADVADNPGGGGSGDTTELLREMIKRNLPYSCAALLWDPETVQRAIDVGVGNKAMFKLGGKTSPEYGSPIEAEAYVAALSDGNYTVYDPNARNDNKIGMAACLVVGNVQIIVNSTRVACNSADMIRVLGVEPSKQRLLLIKSRGHFRASFQPMSKEIIEVDAPGAVTPNLSRYPFKHLKNWPLSDL